MSSAHRPTWDPAKGRADERHKTQRLSSRDLPAHTKLKFRQPPRLRGEGKEAKQSSVSVKESATSVVASSSESSTDASSDDDEADAKEVDEEDDDDDEDEENDDTAALMRELEKIKRERAEEKERREKERIEVNEKSREEEVAFGNPLLNLEQALKGKSVRATTDNTGGGGSGSYGVKRRWDDDAIFKNQAAGSGDGAEQDFVNDLTRSEFHKKFMQRYIR